LADGLRGYACPRLELWLANPDWELTMTEILAEQLETEESMFVQTAQGVESDGETLTLRQA
jgi:hypothetical protein